MPKVSNKKKEEKALKPSYDARKQYQWKEEDEFAFSGPEFSTLYNTLKEAALSPNGTSAYNLALAYDVVQKALIAGVEVGLVTEQEVPAVEDAVIVE